MNLDEVRAAVEKVTYKPGWSFEVRTDSHEGMYLRILAPVPDDPQQEKTLGINTYLPPFTGTEELARWILWRVERIEVHEARELLRFDGKQVSNPHVVNA